MVGGIIGLSVFIPLCIKILKKESIQNPLTYLLWSVLDAIFAGAALLENGNYIQAMLFATCGLITMGCILYVGGRPKWTWFENQITFMAALCMVIWFFTTNTIAATASICALMIASVPQIVDTWRKPKGTPTKIYFWFTISNILATFGGKEVSVIEIGYPLSGFVVCLIITLFSIRKV